MGPSKTIVLKLGSSSIIHETTHQPLLSLLSSVAETIVTLRHAGHQVILVSSGAIAVGMKRMELRERSSKLSGKQALAAIGQGRLIKMWDDLFSLLGQPVAQILLTRGDISDRTRYLNAVNTFKELLSMGVVPIVNENDTVSVSEIKFGDNDTLSAVTSGMVHADYLFLLTDVDGLYTSNPRKDPHAQQVEVVHNLADIRGKVNTSTSGSSLGTGGMETKLVAAEIATGAGTSTVIASSKTPSTILSIIDFHENPSPDKLRPPHTIFLPSSTPLPDLKSWTAHTLYPSGSVVIDRGAYKVLARRDSGGRLLAAGVLGVIGRFTGGVAVKICILRDQGEDIPASPGYATPDTSLSRSNSTGRELSSMLNAAEQGVSVLPTVSRVFAETDIVEVGRGLANYNSVEIEKVKRLKSSQIVHVLGYADSEYVVENVTIRVLPSS